MVTTEGKVWGGIEEEHIGQCESWRAFSSWVERWVHEWFIILLPYIQYKSNK